MFSLIIATPMTVLFWRGVWTSFDQYIFSENLDGTCSADGNINCVKLETTSLNTSYMTRYESPTKYFMILFMYGLVMLIILQLVQRNLENYVDIFSNIQGYFKTGLYGLLSYLYIAINAVANVALWYGLWNIMEEASMKYVARNFSAPISSKPMFYSEVLILSLIILMLLRSFGEMMSCPLLLQFDGYKYIFVAQSYSKAGSNEIPKSMFLLKLLRYITITCFTVMVWWSTWSICNYMGNHHLLKMDANLARPAKQHILWDSLIGGYSLCSGIYASHLCLQRSANMGCAKQTHDYCHHLIYGFLSLIGTIGCILSWRGLWSMFDVLTELLIPRQPENFLLTTLIAVLVLITFGCFNTSTSRGRKSFESQLSFPNRSLISLTVEHPLMEFLSSMNEKSIDCKSTRHVEMCLINDNAMLLDEQEEIDLNDSDDQKFSL